MHFTSWIRYKRPNQKAVAIDQNEELRFWLALLRAPGIGPATFNKLLATIGHPAALFDQPRKILRSLQLSDPSVAYLLNPDWTAVDSDLLWLSKCSHHALRIDDPQYPALLKEIAVPPPILFAIGDLSLLSKPQIAIVGSRNPSTQGKQSAFDFSASLASAGLCITSGLALGIDAASHTGSMAVNGKTIAVTGTGLDRVYPACHKELAHEISTKGAVVSEFILGSAAKAGHFPRRNRIISGLSLGTLVIEAATRSGSLTTARQAIEEGREVFAIPGSIHNPLARGCNALIRQGAKLVETADDVLDELNMFTAGCEKPEMEHTTKPVLEKVHENILKFVAYSPTSIDTLVEQTGESAESIASTLLVLELQGFVHSAAGGCYYRVK